MTEARRSRLRLRRPTWRGWFAIVCVVGLVTLVTLWAIDYGTLHNRVARNVTIENIHLGRKSPRALQRALAQANSQYGKGSVIFIIEGKEHRLSASSIGLHLDEAATLASARQIARDDPPVLRPLLWSVAWVAPRRVPVRITLDHAKLATALAALPGQIPVIEPRVVGSVDAIGTAPGKSGIAFDSVEVAKRIERVARTGRLPLRIPLVAKPLAPSVSDTEIAQLAQRAREISNRPISLEVPGSTELASTSQLRSWITSEVPPGSGKARLTMDATAVRDSLAAQFGRTVVEATSATFTVVGNQVYLVPQVNGKECCSLYSGAVILDALQRSQRSVKLPLKSHPPTFTTKAARKLGITTLLGAGLATQPQKILQVGSLPSQQAPSTPVPSTTIRSAPSSSTTTTLPNAGGPGQFIVPIPNRRGQYANVTSAIPLLRGRILKPGASLSLNTVLGPPSPANGFVAADVLTPDGPSWVSGGGTDLMAAALFSSAYASGMDITSSATPGVLRPGIEAGIDATLGWPGPDLTIKNPSKKSVLIWADLVRGGIRVQLFGTPFTSSVRTSSRVTPFGPENKCLAADVTRTRNFLDGRQLVDRFSARYTPPPNARDDPKRVICPT